MTRRSKLRARTSSNLVSSGRIGLNKGRTQQSVPADAPVVTYRLTRPEPGSDQWILHYWCSRPANLPDLTLVSGVTGHTMAVIGADRPVKQGSVAFAAPSLPCTVALQPADHGSTDIRLVHPPAALRWIAPAAAPPGPKATLRRR